MELRTGWPPNILNVSLGLLLTTFRIRQRSYGQARMQALLLQTDVDDTRGSDREITQVRLFLRACDYELRPPRYNPAERDKSKAQI